VLEALEDARRRRLPASRQTIEACKRSVQVDHVLRDVLAELAHAGARVGGPPLGHGCGLHQLHELVFGELLQVSLDGAVVACVSGIAEETSEERALLLCGLPRPPVVDVRPVLGATLDSGVGREDRSSVPDGVVYRFVRKLLRLQAKELRYL